ncbi:fumarylacetoacetate hydrolase family protein [Salinicoccus bachuensis]|uniref:Fumarylacetoacetate hydrolase family protein n=1 Tax=Salinicoccus bachuensis TaxID=3136731 RepID=A0ABZ3CJK3_9STAP
MGIHIVRYEKDDETRWGALAGEEVIPLANTSRTLDAFLEEGPDEAKTLLASGSAKSFPAAEAKLLSPVTKPARIVCQGANYSSHREESGLEAARPPFNMIFSKADSSLCGAYEDVIRPEGIKLLDYEIELGLVIGTEITEASDIKEDDLHNYVAGLVITNDISARDIQLPQGQWLKGKSYRTFCPTGPYLYLLDGEEVPLINELELDLWVNDELRQSANTDQLLFKPAETLMELSEIMDLSRGDLVMTGTTGGVAMNLTPELLGKVTSLAVPGQDKIDMMVEDQAGNGRYLKDGDLVRCAIRSADGKINLGEQRNRIVPQSDAPPRTRNEGINATS